MTPRSRHYIWQTALKNVSRIIPALVGMTLFMGVFGPTALASSADCQTIDQSRSTGVEGITGSKDTSLPLTLTVQRDLLPSVFLEAAPLLRSRRFNRGLGGGNSCWAQSFRRHPAVNHALVRSFGKSSVKSITPVTWQLALPYNGKRQVLQARTTPPEILITRRERTSDIIGPVPETATTDPSKFAGLSQAIALRTSPIQSLAWVEGRPILATDVPMTSFRLPVSESLRMNMTTTQALHGGNCASGCP